MELERAQVTCHLLNIKERSQKEVTGEANGNNTGKGGSEEFNPVSARMLWLEGQSLIRAGKSERWTKEWEAIWQSSVGPGLHSFLPRCLSIGAYNEACGCLGRHKGLVPLPSLSVTHLVVCMWVCLCCFSKGSNIVLVLGKGQHYVFEVHVLFSLAWDIQTLPILPRTITLWPQYLSFHMGWHNSVI